MGSTRFARIAPTRSPRPSSRSRSRLFLDSPHLSSSLITTAALIYFADVVSSFIAALRVNRFCNFRDFFFCFVSEQLIEPSGSVPVD